MVRDPHFVNQSLEEVFAKAGGMRQRQSDILIQMKQLNFSPINFVMACQRIEKIQLGRSCCGDDSRPAPRAYGPANRFGSLFSVSFAQQFLVIEHSHPHSIPPCNAFIMVRLPWASQEPL